MHVDEEEDAGNPILSKFQATHTDTFESVTEQNEAFKMIYRHCVPQSNKKGAIYFIYCGGNFNQFHANCMQNTLEMLTAPRYTRMSATDIKIMLIVFFVFFFFSPLPPCIYSLFLVFAALLILRNLVIIMMIIISLSPIIEFVRIL